MQPDIIDRLQSYAEANEITGLYTEANCAYDAIEEIKKLRQEKINITTAFRINMMKWCEKYTHEEFDEKLKQILKSK